MGGATLVVGMKGIAVAWWDLVISVVLVPGVREATKGLVRSLAGLRLAECSQLQVLTDFVPLAQGVLAVSTKLGVIPDPICLVCHEVFDCLGI